MDAHRVLTSQDVREVGEMLFGATWQGEMAKAVGVPRQSIGYYLKSGGVSGTQAAAIIGLVARGAARERRTALEQQSRIDARQDHLSKLLHRFDNR